MLLLNGTLRKAFEPEWLMSNNLQEQIRADIKWGVTTLQRQLRRHFFSKPESGTLVNAAQYLGLSTSCDIWNLA